MRVLFVCEGNINRSQMAAAFFRHYALEVDVASAGTLVDSWLDGKPLTKAGGKSITAMREKGLDMDKEVIIQLTPELVEEADKVVLVGPTPGGPLPEYLARSPKLETWDVPDPGYGQISVEGAREMIKEKVKEFVERIS